MGRMSITELVKVKNSKDEEKLLVADGKRNVSNVLITQVTIAKMSVIPSPSQPKGYPKSSGIQQSQYGRKHPQPICN